MTPEPTSSPLEPPPTLSREATAAAFQKHLVARGSYTGSWEALAELFAADATYRDAFFGEMKGKEDIRQFLRKSMKGLEDWSFPVVWTVVSEGQVVVHWQNRLPGSRPDGTYFEFPGVSCITYGADGLIVRQMDIYDSMDAIKIVLEARTGRLGQLIRRVSSGVGTAVRELARAVYRVRSA